MDKLIDVHHHIVPKEYTKSLSKIGVNKGIGVQLPNWNPKKPFQSWIKIIYLLLLFLYLLQGFILKIRIIQ